MCVTVTVGPTDSNRLQQHRYSTTDSSNESKFNPFRPAVLNPPCGWRLIARAPVDLGINNLHALENPVTCRTRLSGKRSQRLIVLAKAGRFLAIADHFGRINDNWRALPVTGQAATVSSQALSLAPLMRL